MAPVQFWFEFASTYSYLAAMRIAGLAAARGVPFEWRPFVLGPIFARQGWNDSPYNLNPARGAYMWHDVARASARLGIPFRKPGKFPRNSVLAARVACASEGEPWLPDYVRAVFVANFGDDREIAERRVVEEVLRSIGQDDAAVIAEALEPGNKDKLRERTELAWRSGVIGAPTMIVGGEVFWGNDRLEEAFAYWREG